MSKLAHSSDEHMAEIDRRAAARDGYTKDDFLDPKPVSVAPDDEVLNIHRFTFDGRPIDVDGEHEFVKAPEVRHRIAELRAKLADAEHERAIVTADYANEKARAETAEAALAACRDKTIEECAAIAEQKAREYLSPEYSTGQPLASFGERFACGQIAESLRAMKGTAT